MLLTFTINTIIFFKKVAIHITISLIKIVQHQTLFLIKVMKDERIATQQATLPAMQPVSLISSPVLHNNN
jgi:hypothetical protein